MLYCVSVIFTILCKIRKINLGCNHLSVLTVKWNNKDTAVYIKHMFVEFELLQYENTPITFVSELVIMTLLLKLLKPFIC